METRNFQYGGGYGEIENKKAIEDQFYARNQLRNALVALDRETRAQFNQLTNQENSYNDRIEAINAEIESLRAEIMALRVPKAGEKAGKWRKSYGKDTPQAKRIGLLEKERKDLRPLAKVRQIENREKYREPLLQLEKERRARINVLYNRAVAGYVDDYSKPVPPLFWMNASEICDEHGVERTAAMKNKTQLQFHSFRAVRKSRTMVRYHIPELTPEQQHLYEAYEREIALLRSKRDAVEGKAREEFREKISHLRSEFKLKIDRKQGWTEEELLTGTTLIRIDPLNIYRDVNNPTVWDKSLARAERRRRMETRVQLRIGSDQKRKPVWASIPIVFHRPIPLGAVVKEAAIGREKIGSKYRWNMTLTVKYNASEARAMEGVVAIDLGWAQETLTLPDGRIRVAGIRIKNSTGERFEEFCLPDDYQKRLEYLNNLKSTLDKHTNDAFDAIKQWRKSNAVPESLSEILNNAEASLRARKEVGRTPPTGHLRSLVWALRKNDVVCVGLQEIIELWYERFMHLSEWIANGRDNLLAWKKDYYRRFAHRLALENRILLLDADDFGVMAKAPDPESGKKNMKNELRFLAAPSMLREALEQSFHAGCVFYSPGLASSRTCSCCEHVNGQLEATRIFKCAACGHQDDREANATANVMRKFERTPGTFSTKLRAAERLGNLNAKEESEEQADTVSDIVNAGTL